MEHDTNPFNPSPYRAPDGVSPLGDALVERYLLGSCAPADVARVEAWIREHPDRGAALLALRHRAMQPWPEPPRFDVAGMHGRLWERLKLHDRSKEQIASRGITPDGRRFPRTPQHLSFAHRSWRSVAIVAMSAIAVVAVAITMMGRPRGGVSGAERTYATTAGQRAMVQLSDGSRVTLGPRTTMRVASRYGASDRVVSLVGEAYFEIGPAQDSPFRVQTGSVTTDVLGTTFGVRRYAADTTARIVVASGKVRVRNSYTQVTLTAGLATQLSDSTRAGSVVNAVSGATDWVEGRLVFNNVSTRELLDGLGRWYGYDFRLADSSLARARVTATFRTGAPAETMRLLKDLLDVTLTFDDSVVTLHSRNGRAPVSIQRKRHDMAFPPTVEVGK
jgi:ferric-dicitrate binding protein FerR (iron transport regulator)